LALVLVSIILVLVSVLVIKISLTDTKREDYVGLASACNTVYQKNIIVT